MNTVAAGEIGSPNREPSARTRLLWTALPRIFVAGIFLQAVFAGSMMSGAEWARRAHAVNAMVLGVALLAAGLAALITLRGVRHGMRLGATLLGLAALVIVQTMLGKMLAQGADLMWLHVPLGVALVGLAGYATSVGRRLGSG